MRIVSYTLIAVGLLLFAKAGYDEYRGVTHSPRGRYTSYTHYTITKQAQPEQFHNAMTYHWAYAGILAIAGVIALLIDKGQERADPMSPDFAGNKELDEWGKLLDEEVERRKGPKP